MNTTRERNALRPTTDEERARRAAGTGGTPTLDFGGEVPYDTYVHASTLHSLQQTVTDEPGEMSFLIVSQVMELYFKLVTFELREARRWLSDDDEWQALAPLRRAALHLHGLDASWQSLHWMTPDDFNRFRDQLGEGSGFQSAMYRHMEFLLGLKWAKLVRPFKRQPDVYDELTRTLHEPSVWDATIALLARRGYRIPASVLERDFSEEHEPHPAVEDAWVDVYRNPGPGNHLWTLGQALVDVAEQFDHWRYHHLGAVRRTMGAKPGTGGSDGIGWLERSMARVVFPELWSARSRM